MPDLVLMRPQRQEAIARMALGESIDDVAQRLGLQPDTVRGWRRRPEFAAELARLQLEQRERAGRKLSAEVNKSLAVLVELRDDPDVPPAVRRGAACDLLDRAGLVAPTIVATAALELADIRPEMLRALLGLQPDELRRLRSSEVVDVEASENDHPDDERPEK